MPESTEDMLNQFNVPGSPELPSSALDDYLNRQSFTEEVKPITPQTISDKIANFELGESAVSNDPFKMSKNIMGDFRNPHLQNQFYERYANHPKFDELGFTPFRDNESLYNEKSSAFDDLRRSAGSWATLTALGFADAASFGEQADRDMARQFEHAMAAGSSSRGGVGGFTTNLFLNSGYTVGIMGELAAEELAMALAEVGLGAATVGSGGTAGAGTLPAMGAIATRMGQKAYSAFTKLNKAFNVSKNVRRTLDNLQDVNKARGYFNKVVRGTADVLNPLENTVDFLKNMDKLDDFSKLGKTAKGFGEFYKDVRNIRLAYGEGALEGGMVQNEMERTLLEDFRSKNGRAPNREEAFEIKQTAAAAGATTSMINAPLILLSNKLTFDGLARGKFKNLGSDIIETGRKGKILFSPRKGVKEAYKAMPTNYFKARWEYIRNPALIGKGIAKYGKANIAEGIQEIGQETIGGASTDYYTAKYQGDSLRGGYYAHIGSNLMKQVSHQGFETFMSGFLMGGMIAPISRGISQATQGKQLYDNLKLKFTDPGKYAEQKAQEEQLLNEDIEKLNKFYANPEKYLAPELENLAEQKEFMKAMDLAKKNGDKKTFYDMKDASTHKHITTALKYGRLDSFIELYEDMRNLKAEEIEKMGMKPDEFNQFLDGTIQRARNIESLWKTANEKYQNPFNPSKYKQGTEERHDEWKKYNAWNKAIEELTLHQDSFSRALDRQSSILEQAKDVSGLKNTPYSQYKVLFTVPELALELNALETEIKGIELSEEKSAETRRILKDRKARYDTLSEFSTVLDDLYASFEPNEGIPEQKYNAIKKAYTKYLNALADNNNDFKNSDSFDKSLDMLLDYHLLENRAKRLNSSVNMLLDPKGFLALQERIKETSDAIHRDRKNEIEKSLAEFKKMMTKNKLLEALYDEGMFMKVEDIIAMDKGTVPTKFYYVPQEGTESSSYEVQKNSDDYVKAMSFVKEYMKDQPEFTKDIDDAEYVPYATRSRNKDENDKRIYNDYAEEYGFDPQADESKVPLKKVLQTVIDSEFSTDGEVQLAKKLLEIATDEETVTFITKSSNPGFYNSAEDTVKMDARYFSWDYKQGRYSNPIETVILHEEIHRRTVKSLDTNQEFNSKITALREETEAYFNTLSPAEQQQATKNNRYPFYGTMNNAEFVAEAMSNENFQKFLMNVDSKIEGTKGSTWKGFVDAVLSMIMETIGISPNKYNGTVLNAAFDIITTEIDATYKVAEEAEKSTGSIKGGVKKDTRIQDIKVQFPELYNKLVDLYKELQPNLPSGLQLEGIEGMSPEAITSSEQFSRFMADPSFKRKEDLIKEYREPQTETKKMKFKGKGKTLEVKKRLAELGYSDPDISKMTPLNAVRIAEEGITKTQAERQKEEADLTEEAAKAEKVRKLKQDIHDIIDPVKNGEELYDAQDAIEELLSTNPVYLITEGAYTSSDIEKLFLRKYQELNSFVNFDAIQEGEVLLDRKGVYLTVVKKGPDSIKVRDYGKIGGKTITIERDNVESTIQFKYSDTEGFREEVEPEIDETDKKLAEESVENVQQDDLQKSVEEANKKSQEDVDNDFIDSIC